MEHDFLNQMNANTIFLSDFTFSRVERKKKLAILSKPENNSQITAKAHNTADIFDRTFTNQ